MTTLKIVCAWCGKPMGEKDGEGQEGISHSICPECADKVMAPDDLPWEQTKEG